MPQTGLAAGWLSEVWGSTRLPLRPAEIAEWSRDIHHLTGSGKLDSVCFFCGNHHFQRMDCRS